MQVLIGKKLRGCCATHPKTFCFTHPVQTRNIYYNRILSFGYLHEKKEYHHMEEVEKTGELAKTKKQKPPKSFLNESEKGLVARIQGELKHKLAAPAAATSKKNKPSE